MSVTRIRATGHGSRATKRYDTMFITAPAKINLYLRVIRKMDDGYHEIETLFERISIYDRISVEPARDRTTMICDDSRVPTGENSLLGRTVSAFNKSRGKDSYFRVAVEKNIPVGAGLGGGSSDAAALLKGLNRISGYPLDRKAMLDISRALGADVPFFLSDCSFGVGKGRGDIIEKVEAPLDIWHVIVKPPFGISTKEAYGKVSAFGLTKNMGVDKMVTVFLDGNDIGGLAENLRNDLQEIVLRDFPVLNNVLSELRTSGARGALLSGSGSAVFGIFERAGVIKAARRMGEIFPPGEGWKVYVARTC